MRARASGAMPQPESRIVMVTYGAAQRRPMSIFPDAPQASTALINTFVTARTSGSWKPCTSGSVPSALICTASRSGTVLRATRVTSSDTSMSAAGPSGSRPNCAKLLAIVSRRAASSASTSTVSRSSSGADRRSRSTANRIGVSGFLSSCAKRRADSRNASARSASSARRRPVSSSWAIVRIPVRSTSNSGAPRRSGCSGMGRPVRISPVHPTSSSSGRLS